MSRILKQTVLPPRPVKNREKSLNDGGDCGACVVAGLLGFPDAEDAYKLHRTGTYYGGAPIPQIHDFSRRSMIDTLEVLASDTGARGGLEDIPVLLDHAVSSVPVWLDHAFGRDVPFGLRAQFEWREYARAMLNGGYYGLAQVKHGGYAEDAPVKSWGWTDHWIMICGWRYRYEVDQHDEARRAAGLGSYTSEWLIGDSSRARPLETWVDANDFANRWGGYSAIWARPLAPL